MGLTEQILSLFGDYIKPLLRRAKIHLHGDTAVWVPEERFVVAGPLSIENASLEPETVKSISLEIVNVSAEASHETHIGWGGMEWLSPPFDMKPWSYKIGGMIFRLPGTVSVESPVAGVLRVEMGKSGTHLEDIRILPRGYLESGVRTPAPASETPPQTLGEPAPGLEVVPAAPEAEPKAAPVPAPSGHPAGPVLTGMEVLVPLAKDLPIDPADLAFVSKSLEMIAGLAPQDVEQEAKVLYNCVWQLEGLSDRYARGAAHPALGGAVGRFVEALAARKEALSARLAQIGFRLFPREAAGAWADIKAAVGEDAVVALPVFSDRKSGTVAGIRRSGVRTERGVVEKAQVLVSQGPSEAAAALEAALAGLLAVKTTDPKDRALVGRGVKEIHKFLGALPSQPDGFTFARFTVNALNDLDSGNRLKGAIRDLIAYLEKGGFQEILVPLGETFDESFSPGKYERKKVPSDRPKDKIVGILQRGFLDSKGVCIQKAVVAVSKG